jgi:hypothetical protein
MLNIILDVFMLTVMLSVFILGTVERLGFCLTGYDTLA